MGAKKKFTVSDGGKKTIVVRGGLYTHTHTHTYTNIMGTSPRTVQKQIVAAYIQTHTYRHTHTHMYM